MSIRHLLSSLVAGAALFCVSGAHANNVALGKPVTLTSGSVDSFAAALSTLTDGVFVGTATQYQQGTVYWDLSNSPTFELNLGGLYSISSITLEHDHNDLYLAFYPVGSGVAFASFTAPNNVGGMVTTTKSFLSPITASKLTFLAFGGDGQYAMSEIQVNAVLVPEPGSYAMMLAGLALMGGVAARRKARAAV